jgi:hypothetical protein
VIFQHLPGHRMKSKVVIDLTRSDGDNTAIAITVSAYYDIKSKCQSSI